MTKTQLADLGERAGWTVAQALVGLGIAEAANIRTWWAAPIAMALSAAKTYVQHQLDNRRQPPEAAPEVGP